MFEEGVTPLMLQLLGYAICEMKTPPSSSPQKSKKDKEKSKSKEKDKDKDKEKDKDKTAGWLLRFIDQNSKKHRC